jgi:hypothetical protein
METFELERWKRDMLAFYLMEFCRLKLKDLFKAVIFIILTLGQILVPCQFWGYRVLNYVNLPTFLANLLKLLLTYFIMQRDSHVRY